MTHLQHYETGSPLCGDSTGGKSVKRQLCTCSACQLIGWSGKYLTEEKAYLAAEKERIDDFYYSRNPKPLPVNV